jgi:hypothetical protein
MPFRGVFPAAKLTPAPFGLFSVADVTRHSGADEHWAKEFDQESESCAFDASIVDVCGAEAPVQIFNTNSAMRWVNVTPFGIIAQDKCLTVGWSVEDRRARVIRQLELVTPKAVETELWSGFYKQELENAETGMYLSSTTATTVDPGAQKPKVGLGLLEQALAQCSTGFQGVIHMTPLVGAMIGVDMQRDGDQLTSSNGNSIVIGTGYDGRGPGDNNAPTSKFIHWIYATGPVFVHLGANELITVSDDQAVNTKTNESTWVAERPASVHWDGCCHFAVQVDVRM